MYRPPPPAICQDEISSSYNGIKSIRYEKKLFLLNFTFDGVFFTLTFDGVELIVSTLFLFAKKIKIKVNFLIFFFAW